MTISGGIRSAGRGLVVLAAATAGIAAVFPSSAALASAPGPRVTGAVTLPATSPPVQVRGGELVDVADGEVLWGKHVNVARPMGSIAKVMTALVVLQAGHLGRKIKVSSAAVRYVTRDGASSAGLVAGDVLTARQLLEAMLLPSGCDAAYLLATAYGPGRPRFIRKMNAMARRIGMTHTHFSSFDGMPFPTEHSTYSSPADLIRLGERAMRDPVFRRIVAQRSYHIRQAASHHGYLWYSTNGLIGSYAGADGIKTGNTNAAGNCLLFEAKRDGTALIGVVLHASPTSVPGAAITAGAAVLTWGFGPT